MAHSSRSCFVSLHIFLKIEWHMNKLCSCLPSAFTFASLNQHQPELTSLTPADSKCCRLDSKWHQGVWTCHSSASLYCLPVALRIDFRIVRIILNHWKALLWSTLTPYVTGLLLRLVNGVSAGYSEVLARKQSWLCVGLQSSYSKLWNSLPT